MTLEQALAYVLTPAGLAVFLAFVIERVPAFGYLSANQKRALITGLTFGLPLLATIILLYFNQYLAVIEPYWQAIFIAAVVYTSGQFGHWFDKVVILKEQ